MEFKETLKKGKDINESEFGKLALKITDGMNEFIDDYKIEIKVERIKGGDL
jgi:hypothetical protein